MNINLCIINKVKNIYKREGEKEVFFLYTSTILNKKVLFVFNRFFFIN